MFAEFMSKEIGLKYSSLALKEKISESVEEIKARGNVAQTELKACQELLHKEKSRTRDLGQELMVVKSKCQELEKYVGTLTEMIADKDRLINKIWDELLNIKKSRTVVDGESVLKNIEEENEISEEGEVGSIQQPVGRSIIYQTHAKANRKAVIENLELNKLKNELVESKESCKQLNDRLRNISELYTKLEVDNDELRERLKLQVENTNQLTQQILRQNHDKELHRCSVNEEIDALMNRVDVLEREKKRAEKRLVEQTEESNNEIFRISDALEKVRGEKNMLFDENLNMKAEIKEMIGNIRSKEMDIAKLYIEIDDLSSKSVKKESFFEKHLDINALVIENKDLKSRLNEIMTNKSSINLSTLQTLLKLDSFKFCSETKLFLIETFGEDSAELFNKIQSLVSRYKSKIKSLKSQIQKMKMDRTDQMMSENIRFSNITMSTQEIDTPQKNAAVSEIYLNTPTYYSELEKYKFTVEKLKNAKRKAIAEKEQVKEDLAHAILNISELQTKIMTMQLEVNEHDFVAFVACEAAIVEKLLIINKSAN